MHAREWSRLPTFTSRSRVLRPLQAGRRRQCEEEAGSAMDNALGPDSASVDLDNPPCDRQTEPSALLCSLRRLPVSIEDVIELRLRDPVAGIAHGELDLVDPSPRLDANMAVAARE